MGGAMEAERQLQDMLEKVGQHRLAALMREPIGEQRHKRPANDDEKTKADPCRHEGQQVRPGQGAASALYAGQTIDDASEQHRLGELGGGQRHIAEGKRPAQTNLRAEQPQHPHVELEHVHRLGPCLLNPGRRKRHKLSWTIPAPF